MATIGYATLQIIPSLKGVTEAIEKQLGGTAVDVKVTPKVDQPAAEKAGKQTKETVEKHTTQVKVEPKVDQAKAEEAGKKTGEAVARGTTGASSAVGQALIGVIQGAGGQAGLRLGQKLAEQVPTGMTGAAERIATALRNSLPTVGQSAGVMLGTAVGVGLTNAIGKERLDKAGRAVMSSLTTAVKAANNATDIGVVIGNSVANGLRTASGSISGAAGTITDIVGGITAGVGTAKKLLGGDDSWAAPGLDALTGALSTVSPLLEGMNSAAMLASAGAQAISVATGIASKAQLLWNAALIANPIGLIVAAIAAVVAGLVLFFTKTEIGRKIWEGFTEYLKIAWEVIKVAFSAAWDVISAIWDGMVQGAAAVWNGVKEKFTAVVDFVKGLPGAIANAAKGLWDGLKSGLVAVLNWIGDKWNAFASALSIDLPGDMFDVNIPKMPRFSYSDGGYTGSVGTDRVAGVVHGGEYVIKASATTGIENAYPGLLDYLNNKGALPGFQGGGKVQLGNISGPGITSGEQQSMWDAVRGKFPDAILSSATRTEMTEGHPDYHNAGRAIDISGPGMGAIAAWIASTYPESMELIHSPFGHNIKDGKDVGDGMSFYGAGQMAAHRNHVHWALGKTAKAFTPSTEMLPALNVPTTAPSSPATETTSAPAEADKSTSMTMPGSLSGLSRWGVDGLGVTTKSTPAADSPERTFEIGKAAGEAVSGQVASALSVFGVNDSPGWLKGISTLVGGIKVGGGDSAAPIAASPINAASSAVSAANAVHSGSGQPPGPQTVYNIQTTDIEPAYLASQRNEKERTAARLARY